MSSNNVKSTFVPWVSLFLSEDKRDLGNKFKKAKRSYSKHVKLPSSITLRFNARDAADKVMYNKLRGYFMQPPQEPRKTSRINNVFMAEFFYVVAEKKKRGYNTQFF